MLTTNPRPGYEYDEPAYWYKLGYWDGTTDFVPQPYDNADFNNVRTNIFFGPGFGRFPFGRRFPFFFFPPFFFLPPRRRRRFFW